MSLTSSPKIFYVGNFLFPDSDAGSHRVYGIGKALRESGYEVVYLGAESFGRPQDALSEDVYKYDSFLYYPSSDVGSSLIRRGIRLWSTYFTGQSVMKRLDALWTEQFVAVFAYQVGTLLLAQLRRFCTMHNIVLVTDVVEWYDSSHVLLGRFGPLALDSAFSMRYMQGGYADGVLAISSYLENYYSRNGKPTVRVPVLIDYQTNINKWMTLPNIFKSTLQLSFVGNAGKKDLLVNAIRGLMLLGNEARSCELVIVGPSRGELAESLGRDAQILDWLNDTLRFVGKVTHEVAMAYVKRADFSILLRPDLRFAHAGFPTKLVESLSMGVPVICNLTSDVGMYVRDGQEGLVVSDCSPEAFANGLRRAMALSFEQREDMRFNACRRAEISFDYRNWSRPLSEFMYQVKKRHSA